MMEKVASGYEGLYITGICVTAAQKKAGWALWFGTSQSDNKLAKKFAWDWEWADWVICELKQTFTLESTRRLLFS